LLILALANGISLLTSFSLSAIATNLRVKGGGDYYLISRTLGLQFGGSIGIVLYLAQSVLIAFYCIGFGEVVAELIGSPLAYTPQVIAATLSSAMASYLGAPRILQSLAADRIFPLVVLAGDRKDAVQVLVQSFGIGPLHANTVLLAWTNDTSDTPDGLGFGGRNDRTGCRTGGRRSRRARLCPRRLVRCGKKG